MKRAVALGAAVFLAACGSPPVAAVRSSPSPSASPFASPSALATASASPTPAATPTASPTAPPPASANCAGRPDGGPMVLVGRAIYEVADPVHPKLLCTIRNTAAHLFTGDTFTYARPTPGGFEVVLHSMGSGNESVIASFPIAFSPSWGGYPAWTADAAFGATATQDDDAAGNPQIHIWLASQRGASEVYAFQLPLTDSISRFGLQPPTLAFSPDGQFLLSGWPVGKSAAAAPLEVHSVADRSPVKSFDPAAFTFATWVGTGHRLIVSGPAGTQAWTPEDGMAAIGTTRFGFEPSVSPDGGHVAYSAYKDPASPTSLRVYAYDLSRSPARLLIDKLRSDVLFVKDGWVWYQEEGTCDPQQPNCSPEGTAPTGREFAMNLSAGAETPLVFAAGESPEALQSGWAWGFGDGAPQFWPNA